MASKCWSLQVTDDISMNNSSHPPYQWGQAGTFSPMLRMKGVREKVVNRITADYHCCTPEFLVMLKTDNYRNNYQ